MPIRNMVTGGSKDLLSAALQRERKRLEQKIERRKVAEARVSKAKSGPTTTEAKEREGGPQEQQDTTTSPTTTQGTLEGTKASPKNWSSVKANRFGGASLRSDLGMDED